MHRVLVILIVPLIVALFLMCINGFTFYNLRSLAGYLSVFVIPAATYSFLKQGDSEELMRKFINFAVYSWLIVGIAQLLIGQDFLSFLLSNMRTGGDSGRGVNSLAAEPTYYGIYCIFLMMLNYLYGNDLKLHLLLLFQILVLSISSMTILFIVLLIAIWLIANVSLRNTLTIIIGLVCLGIIFDYVAPGSRFIVLYHQLIENPEAILATDQSINARLGHALFSVLGSLDNYLFPNGFNTFHIYLEGINASVSWYDWTGGIEDGMKIMSGYGSALFELGIFSITIPVVVTMLIFKRFKEDKKTSFVFAIFLNLIMFSSIQLTFPLFGMVIGILAYQGAASSPRELCGRFTPPVS